jgi:hypothetical protein
MAGTNDNEMFAHVLTYFDYNWWQCIIAFRKTKRISSEPIAHIGLVDTIFDPSVASNFTTHQ